MAKVLYGVSGDGLGHSSRAKVITEHLLKRGHEVKMMSYDRGYKNLKNFFDVEEVFGPNITYKDNEVKTLRTIFRNLLKTPQAVKSVNKILSICETWRPDVVFTDFELISTTVANLKKLPLISIDNQHVLTNAEVEYPPGYRREANIAKATTKLLIFGTTTCLITTFFDAKAKNDKTLLFPPILRNEILEAEPKSGDYILVYLTSKFDSIIPLLSSIKKRFVVYGFDKDSIEKNVVLKKTDPMAFVKDLANAEAIIANAGFTLITEALHLKKPYLALPVKGQFEQLLNAYYLDKLGYGKSLEELSAEKIEKFISELEVYRGNLQNYKNGGNDQILAKVDELVEKHAYKNSASVNHGG